MVMTAVKQPQKGDGICSLSSKGYGCPIGSKACGHYYWSSKEWGCYPIGSKACGFCYWGSKDMAAVQ